MPRQFLVTAGNTRERIDDVRDWGNIFTGKTGLDLALALLSLGDVTLLTSNQEHARDFQNRSHGPHSLALRTFTTHDELEKLIAARLAQTPVDAVLMSAAVADYRPDGAFEILQSQPGKNPDEQHWTVRGVQRGKVKSTFPRIAFTGVPTRKLIDQFRTTWRFTGYLVKFKLEVGITENELLTIAAESRTHSGADLIVANTLEMVRGPTPAAWILGPTIQERIARPELPQRIKTLITAALPPDS